MNEKIAVFLSPPSGGMIQPKFNTETSEISSLWTRDKFIESLSILQVMCPTCLCTGMEMASEHDPRIDPFD